MAWNDALLPASFRGIPFFVDTHEKVGGRNAISHEPPDRDSSFSEDMGKKSDGYRIVGHILGDSYFFLRDALINAMEKKESGTLIHPYLGLIDVQPQNYSFSEDTREGRICRFTLNFIEAGDPNSIFGDVDKVTSFLASVVGTIGEIQTGVALVASFTGLPAYAIDSAESIIIDFADSVKKSALTIKANKAELTNLSDRLRIFTSNAKGALNDLETLSSDTSEIGDTMKLLPAEQADSSTIDTTSGQDDSVAIFDNVLRDMDVTLKRLKEEAIPTTNISNVSITPTREKELTNNMALVQMFQQTMLVKKSEVLADKSFKSKQAALRAREEILEAIDEQIATPNLPDNLFQALKDHKASIASLVPNPAQNLGSEKTLNLAQTTNSIVLSYDLYGSLEQETDILDKNKIENPGFISGDIEVISNVF